MHASEPTIYSRDQARGWPSARDGTPMPPDAVWRRFALTFLVAFFGGLGLIYAALVLIDPYDTGRFPTFMRPGVFDGGQRTANASRGHDPLLPVIFPFPFWLYRGNLEYLENLLSTRAITSARNRIELAMGLVPPTDPRGYSDYETGRIRNFHPAVPAESGISVPAAKPSNTYFPAIEALDGILTGLPPETGFVIVMPPVYQTVLPRPGTQLAADLPACKAELARRLADRPRSGFLDFLVDG